ncbi:MAG: hypothetical protein WC867_04695 [Candidatus Pacearchaeota archaeon]|jgi:hypothetical protein
MNNKIKGSFMILIIFSILILTLPITNAQDSLIGGFKGEWYTKGFLQYFAWKGFVNAFATTILNMKIVDAEGSIKLGFTDSEGNQHLSDNSIGYNKNTGELSYEANISIPGGEFKQIKYNINFNNQKDIRKFINPNDYYNKTLKQLVSDLIGDKINITFSGVNSNITFTPSKNSTKTNPQFDIIYTKNKLEVDTKPVEETSDEENVILPPVINNTNNAAIQPYENLSSEVEIEPSNENDTHVIFVNNISKPKLEIINPNPKNTKVSMYSTENKLFSIDNNEYDSIKWYLDSKILSENKDVNVKDLKKGNYEIKVIIKEGNQSKSKVWKLEVLEKQNKDKSLYFYILIIILVLLIFFIIFYFFRRKRVIIPS